MHILFVHKNFPAQFGHIARHLIQQHGFRCTFVSETPPGEIDGIRKIRYAPKGGATAQTHYCSRTFENAIWHSAGVYEALRPLRDTLAPDLIVGHSGFGSTLFLPELFPNVPLINYFEYYYHPHNSDMDFRKDWPIPELSFLRSRARNAMLLLDLETCHAAYTPTRFQAGLFPDRYRSKIRVLHDGIDLSVWHRRETPARQVGGLAIPPETRVVTYAARGLESMRGFDIFMKAAKRICERRSDVIFLVAGSDRVCYGGDLGHIKEKSFVEYVLKQDQYDPKRIHLLGRVSPETLAELFSISDLHIYLTVPFVLSWSMLNAMACGCTVLGSNTAPVTEIIRPNENGLLCDFHDVEGIAETVLKVLDDPAAFRHLGAAAAETIRTQFSLDVMMPQMLRFYEDSIGVRFKH
jgi:glycosyltransferase involved in cell wall biosynthesis